MNNPFPALRLSGGILFFVLLLLCGCSRISGKLLVMEGNFFHSRELYNEAITAFLKAREDPEAEPYAEYGLGSVYLSLNEGEAARERFAAAAAALGDGPAPGHQDLIFRIHYNTGVVYFEKEQYGEAAAAFRRALETEGGHIEAKRNLELSLLSLARQNGAAGAVRGDSGQEGTESQTNTRIEALFEYLRRKEQDQWKSREWIDPAPASGPDY
jgi:Ca-activated chloride channel family protein